MIDTSILLLHAFHMPHIFGFLPIIAGALAGMAGAAAVGLGPVALGIGGATIGGLAAGALGGATIGANVMAGNKAADAHRKAAQATNDATARQYHYDMAAWEMNKDRLRQQHDYTKQSIETKAANEERLAQYQDTLAQNRYNYDLQIRNREQQSLDAQFLKSNELYDAQTDLNSRTANDARDAEIIKYQELQYEAAFQNDKLLTDALISEGQTRARGQSGRTADKTAQTLIADRGIKQQMIAESVLSGARNTRSVLMEIAKDKEAADMAAFAAKMLDPGVLPEPLEPLAVPTSEFLYPEAPQDFDFGPQPVMGALANVSAASDLGWATSIGGIANLAGGIIPKLINV